jgi:hypothetical protein
MIIRLNALKVYGGIDLDESEGPSILARLLLYETAKREHILNNKKEKRR